MAEKKAPGFVLERDQKEIIDELDNEEAGIIFKAIYEYETTRQEPKLEKALRIVFKQFKVKLDFYDNKYNETCQKNKENAEKRWQRYNDATAYDRMQSDAMDTNKRKENKSKVNKIKENKNKINVCVGNIPSTPAPVFDFCLSVFGEYDEKDLEKSCKRFFKYYKEKEWKGVNNWQDKLEMWIDEDIEGGKIKIKQEEKTDEAGFEYKNGRRKL